LDGASTDSVFAVGKERPPAKMDAVWHGTLLQVVLFNRAGGKVPLILNQTFEKRKKFLSGLGGFDTPQAA